MFFSNTTNLVVNSVIKLWKRLILLVLSVKAFHRWDLANWKGYTASLAVIKQYRELVIYPLSVYRAPILFKIWLYFRRLAKFFNIGIYFIFSIYRCTTSSNYTQCLVTQSTIHSNTSQLANHYITPKSALPWANIMYY